MRAALISVLTTVKIFVLQAVTFFPSANNITVNPIASYPKNSHHPRNTPKRKIGCQLFLVQVFIVRIPRNAMREKTAIISLK
jgi:hypothetical protein